jgi:hypothetical protein
MAIIFHPGKIGFIGLISNSQYFMNFGHDFTGLKNISQNKQKILTSMMLVNSKAIYL